MLNGRAIAYLASLNNSTQTNNLAYLPTAATARRKNIKPHDIDVVGRLLA
jgi:hypothetical protein